jgi:hypothetical protein
MAVAEYQYDYTDLTTSSGKLLGWKLEQDINNAVATVHIACTNVKQHHPSPTQFTVYMAQALDAGEKTALDGVIAVHTGTPPAVYELRATSTLIHNTTVVTHDGSWGAYGDPIATKPESLLKTGDLNNVAGRIYAVIKTDGATAKLRVKEANPDGTNPAYLVTETLPDTSGVWTVHKFYTSSLPRSGDWEYSFEADKAGTTTLELKSVSLTLLENTVS